MVPLQYGHKDKADNIEPTDTATEFALFKM